jgi:hypothetical protein
MPDSETLSHTCHSQNYLTWFQNYLSPVPAVNGLIGNGKRNPGFLYFSPLPLELSHSPRHTYFVSLISQEVLSTLAPWAGFPEKGIHFLLRPSCTRPGMAPCRVFVFPSP